MDESESKKENQNNEMRQFDPDSLKRGLYRNPDQYEMLKRCHNRRDITEWNKWRKDHVDEVIWLQGRDFKGWWLKKANFMHGTFFDSQTKREINYSGEVHLEGAIFKEANLEKANFYCAHLDGSQFQRAKARGASFNSAHLEDANLSVAHLEDCNFAHAFLENADLVSSFLIGANFNKAKMKGCWVRCSVVDGASKFWKCQTINRYSKKERFTDFSGTALDNVIIDPGTKQLLEYNIRRMNWEEWYKENWLLSWPVRWFWCLSDYGISTWRVITWFLVLSLLFATIYANCAYWWPPGIVSDLIIEPHLPIWHYFLLLLLRPIYFSVVTMTTLGVGDMYANAQSIWGHILLSLQVILGYVLLGALVTRFAVLFTAGGPAGKFADDRKQKAEDR